VAYLIVVSLLWAFSFGLIKTQLAGYDPLLVAAARLLLSLAAFAPWLLRHRPPAPLRARLMAVGAVQFGLMYVAYIAAYRYLPAYAVALFTVFTPLYVVLILDFGSGRLRRGPLLGSLLAVVGGALVAWRALPGGAALPGILLLQASNLCFAGGQVAYRRLMRGPYSVPSLPEAARTGWMYLGAALATTAAALLFGHAPDAPPGGRALLALLYLGLIPSALAFHLWNKGTLRASAGGLAVANNLKIPLAVLVAWAVFGEDAPYGRVLAGLAVILAGLAVARGREAE